MSESQGNAGLGRDALGLLLIVIGVFFGAFTVMATIQPKEHPNETTAAFMALVGSVGSVAGMFLALGILFVGVRLWIAGISGRIGRDMLGVLITTITLATLMGAISQGLGGSVGALLGGRVSAFLTPFVGIPYGLCVVLLPAWFLWLRPRALLAWDDARLAAPAAGPSTGSLTGMPVGSLGGQFAGPGFPGQGANRDSARALGQSLGAASGAGLGSGLGSGRIKTTDASSVSAAEAAALLPPTPAPRKLATPPVESAPRSAIPADTNAPRPPNLPRNNAPSPYPVDVRVHGGIPEGARPLETPHARTVQQSPLHVPTVQFGLAHSPSAPQQSAGANLADAERVHVREPRVEPKPVVERSPARERVPGDEVRPHASGPAIRAESAAVEPPVAAPSAAQTFDVSTEDEADAETELAFAEQVEEPLDAAQPSAPTAELASDVKPFSAMPPAPSWEQPGLFEEPVDAYGTPLSLVEELRKSNGETATRLTVTRSDGDLPVAQVDEQATADDAEVKSELAVEGPSLFDEPAQPSLRPNEARAEVMPADDEDEVEDDELAEADEAELDDGEVDELRVVVDETLEVDADESTQK